MWKMPEEEAKKDTSHAALLKQIIKLRSERLSWPIIAKVVGLKMSEALKIYVQSTMP